MFFLFCQYASFSVPQMLRFSNCLLINSSSYVYLCRCSPRLLMPSLDNDSFIKINCDWWGTCNRLFPTTKQIIDDSFFSVTDYCWVYFDVRMFCIGVVIVVLSSDLAWMHALVKKVITNHNMWSIFSTYVSLTTVLFSVILDAWAFEGNETNEHLKPLYRWLHTRVYCPMPQGTRFIMYILDISRSFFSLKWHLKLRTKTTHTGGKLGVFWGFKLFLIIFLSVFFPLPR